MRDLLSVRRRKRQTGRSLGMTLVETMVAIGVMTVILVVVSQVFAVNEDVLVKQLARIDNDNGAIFALKRLGELSRGATSVMTDQTINGTYYASSSTTLVLKLPAVDGSGNILADVFDYIAVYRDPLATTKIYTDTWPGSGSMRVSGKKLLTAYNSTMTFSYNRAAAGQATRVSVFLINTQTKRGSTLTSRTWTSIFLRNF